MNEDDSTNAAVRRIARTHALSSDADVLAALAACPPLADEDDPVWTTDDYWRDYWRDVAEPLLGLLDVARERRLRSAVRLVLERACYGDPGESLRGLRHDFEAIFNPDWRALADEYLALARSPRLGTRLWAVSCLTVMNDPRAVDTFRASVREDPEPIATEAAGWPGTHFGAGEGGGAVGGPGEPSKRHAMNARGRPTSPAKPSRT